MSFFYQFWGSFSFVGALFLAVFLVSHKIEKKHFWFARVLFSTLIALVVCHSYILFLFHLSLPATMDLILRNINCFILFLLALGAMKFSCRCTIWEALFCCVAGYCMQHITQRTSIMIALLFFENLTAFQEAVILAFITLIGYTLFFFIFIQNSHYHTIIADSKLQIAISSLVLLVTIPLSSFANTEAQKFHASAVVIYLYIFSIISAFLAFILEFSLLLQKNTEAERDMIQHLMQENQSQYLIEKNTIDMINIKSHDLKHQIAQLEKTFDPSLLTDVKEAVNAYDFIFHTGNTALDTVLTMKGLFCEKNKITLTCIADGASLFFMSESDIYILFGNILDNAIEAVTKISDPEKRLIGLTICAKHSFLQIHSENYFEGSLSFIDDMPQTTKMDKMYHGFGTHSIKLIAEKYHGACSFRAQDHIFSLDLLLPQNDILHIRSSHLPGSG